MSDGISMQIVLSEVAAERVRQDAKWGEQNHEPTEYLAILVEEVGEAAREAVEVRFGLPGRHRLRHRAMLRSELIQVAAVAVAMVEAIDRYGKKDEAPEADLSTVESEG